MNGKLVSHTQGSVRIDAYTNGRVKIAVNVFRVREGSDPEFVMPDEVNLTRQSEREAFIQSLPEDLQADAAKCALLIGGRLPQLRLEKGDEREQAGIGRAVSFDDPALYPEEVDGEELLNDISVWIRRYMWMEEKTADAIAAWTAATWFVSVIYFAPLRLVLSATKRCGKTLLLDLVETITHRGYQTSVLGATPAVIFRLNELHKPTFLVDEAEKLSNAESELVELFNKGYRRGAKVQRCVDRGGGNYEVLEFDAFGFRALAAIGDLWGTVMDRGILARLERKPKIATVERFIERTVVQEGRQLAQRLARWAADNQDAVARAAERAPRPLWLDDRDCDNWSVLFAVAAIAGGRWPERMQAAACLLSRERAKDETDLGERLLHDVRKVFDAAKWPEAIPSGELVIKLNALDSAPWADLRKGDGISTHKVANMLRPFGVSPRHDRTSGGPDIRGYWQVDLQPVWERYASPPETASGPSQRHSPSDGARNPDSQSVTTALHRDTSKSTENADGMRACDSVTLRHRDPCDGCGEACEQCVHGDEPEVP